MDKAFRIKRKKLNIEGDDNVDGNQSAGASSSANDTAIVRVIINNESQPNMFKLNVDCFEHLFEWLSLKELLVFRCTSKRMKAVVDYYIKLNYPHLLHLCVPNFRQGKFLKSCRMHPNYFESIKHLHIWGSKYIGVQIDGIKFILNRLETLKLWNVRIAGDFYEIILKHCPRLKFLSVKMGVKPIGTSNEWLIRQYSTLESIEIEMDFVCSELLEFFKQNPNVRDFSTNFSCLWHNRNQILESSIKLDRLNVNIDSHLFEFYHIINNLSDHGFYKQLIARLHFGPNPEWAESQLQNLWSHCNLETFILCTLDDFLIPVVKNIKQLDILNLDISSLTTNFVNLERVFVLTATLNAIQSFMSHAPKLKQVRVTSLIHGNGEMPNVHDFLTLNEERKKLVGACKVTIYIDEEIFLKLKWSSKLNFGMVELKRLNSCKKENSWWWT